MEALTSLVEAVLEMSGRKKERESRPVLSSRVPSLRLPRGDGQWESVAIEMVVVDRRRYLLAPDSADIRWAQALRERRAFQLVLSDGARDIAVRELDDRDKQAVLREYAKRGHHISRGWRRLDAADLRRIAGGVPVFEVVESGDAPESTLKQRG